ncbi:MAG: 4-hydroxyphenylpyruvate dioxygenase [Planctomycetota bacterium]|nr:4-hydroxyphenylpyruvate dioxygenase [Planctomycetota bacterium]MEC8337980.1 4-hydroxyphenylpyruvate dioxygenase [Planctomycetota bacterium]
MSGDAMTPKGIHHVELLVGNAKQAAYFYRKAFGFSQMAYAGPETGLQGQASYVMSQGNIRLVLSTPLTPEDPMGERHRLRGDSVLDVAFVVDDVDRQFEYIVDRGGKVAREPYDMTDDHGRVRRAKIYAYGDTLHSLISLQDYRGHFLPGYRIQRVAEPDFGLRAVDHIVGNVEDGKMNDWVQYYEQVFGFNQFLSFDDKDISTEYSALRSKVMASPTANVKFPINEPADGLRKSQIQEYLESHQGPGVQHVALITGDILHTVSVLRQAGVEFLKIPSSYYDSIWDRVGDINEDCRAIEELDILVDRDEEGYLLQIFTRPVEDRPTLFYEIIQRCGSQSFGKGNFKSLFEAIEREQAARGNL